MCFNNVRRSLASTSKHRRVRQRADDAYHKNAERMIEKYAKKAKIHDFRVGEYASVSISRIDRAATDLQHLPCIIVEVIGKAQCMYRLRCRYGVLRSCFHAGDLEPFNGTYNIPLNGWEDQSRISLREAACLQTPGNAFVKNRCNCKSGGCTTLRCHCKKVGIDCSTHTLPQRSILLQQAQRASQTQKGRGLQQELCLPKR